MYNRYINAGDFDDLLRPDASDDAASSAAKPPQAPAFTDILPEEDAKSVSSPQEKTQAKNTGGLKGLFGGNFRLPEFDADTLLLLVLVYFLVADDNENISDTLLIIGALLLLGF